MKASDFVADLGGGTNTHATADFVLYFANKKGNMLKEYKLMNAKYGEKSKEQFIVEQLIRGPKKKGYVATLSNKIKTVNVMTANNICYVDFDESFLNEQSTVSDTLVIYSIVNSLSGLNEVHKVQISINGDAMLEYHNNISLSEPFIRNLDLIESEEDTTKLKLDN
ncbi:MAG: GerMN domain-containing protein [Eubacterium sp.]